MYILYMYTEIQCSNCMIEYAYGEMRMIHLTEMRLVYGIMLVYRIMFGWATYALAKYGEKVLKLYGNAAY